LQTGPSRSQSHVIRSRVRGCLLGGAIGATLGGASRTSERSATLTRAAPLGIVVDDSQDAFHTAAAMARLTHDNPSTYLAAGTFAAIVWHLTRGTDLAAATYRAIKQLNEFDGRYDVTKALIRAGELARQGPLTRETVGKLGSGHLAADALAIALCCGLSTSDSRKAMLIATGHRGDTTATGALCGYLVGAWNGEDKLPADWTGSLAGRAALIDIADEMSLRLREPAGRR
jgi:ADP-ribosylglycohydrolase